MKYLFIILMVCTPLFAKVDLKDFPTSRDWTFEVGENGILERDLSQLAGLKMPENWQKKVTFVKIQAGELPAKYDIRDKLGDNTPPIRDQGYCGSCWAFGSTAPFEFAIALKLMSKPKNIFHWYNPFTWFTSCSCDKDDPPTPPPKNLIDLSEQEMVSCSACGSCNGGWFCHDWQQSPGQALESDFPYTARDVSCKQGLSPWGRIQNYYFIGQGANPTINELKQAIIDYGAIAVTVTANSAMQAYKSGIFNACSSATLNHMVNLIGWNDEGGYWIMRNSWGVSWGESGYMRILYGCSKIGEIASFVIY